MWTTPDDIGWTVVAENAHTGALIRVAHGWVLRIPKDPRRGLEILHRLSAVVDQVTDYYNLRALDPTHITPEVERQMAELLEREGIVVQTRKRLYEEGRHHQRPTAAEQSPTYRQDMRDAGRGGMVP